MKHPNIAAEAKRIRDFRSFVDSDEDGSTDDVRGHGTYSAGLLLKTIPQADIFIARVVDSGGDGTLVRPVNVAKVVFVLDFHWTTLSANELLGHKICCRRMGGRHYCFTSCIPKGRA